MSKLMEKLKQTTGTAPKPMGFGAAPAAERKQKILLIASLAQASTAEHMVEIAAVADAIIIEKPGPASAIAESARRLARIPWGIHMENVSHQEIESLLKAGCDFFVLAQDTPLDLPDAPEMGKVLQVDDSLSEGVLRTVNALPVDAALVAAEMEGKARLTWRHLMFLQRAAELLTKPVLASAPLKVSAQELQMLWKAGVDAVVIRVAEGQATDLKEVRRIIDGLTFPSRQGKKLEAVLPRTSEERETAPEPEVEEEEEDEE